MSIDIIQKGVAEHLGIPLEVLLSRRRTEAVAVARQMCYLYCREFGWSTVETGEAFERDHSTVVKGCQEMEGRLSYDKDLLRQFRKLGHALKGVLR